MNTVSGNYYLSKIFIQDLLFIASHAMACREMSRVTGTGAPESNASGLTIRLISTPRGSSMAEAVVMVPRPRGTLAPAIKWRMATRLRFADMGRMTVRVVLDRFSDIAGLRCRDRIDWGVES